MLLQVPRTRYLDCDLLPHSSVKLPSKLNFGSLAGMNTSQWCAIMPGEKHEDDGRQHALEAMAQHVVDGVA